MVELVSYTPNYLDVIAGAMSKCYDKKASHKAIHRAIQAGHLSILEHAYATLDIECSLAMLGQITRHRHFSFTVQSTRGSRMDKAYYIPKRIFKGDPYGLYTQTMEKVFDVYNKLIEAGVALEDVAYILPKGTKTKLRITGNLRAWFEYLPKRLCSRALPEHKEQAERIHSLLADAMPDVFARGFLQCERCTEGGCQFHNG